MLHKKRNRKVPFFMVVLFFLNRLYFHKNSADNVSAEFPLSVYQSQQMGAFKILAPYWFRLRSE